MSPQPTDLVPRLALTQAEQSWLYIEGKRRGMGVDGLIAALVREAKAAGEQLPQPEAT